MYAELPLTAVQAAADDFAEAAAAFRALDMPEDAWLLVELRSLAARAQWTVIAVMLDHALSDLAGAAQECADAFAAAGAPHLEHEVLRALETFHALQGNGAERRADPMSWPGMPRP